MHARGARQATWLATHAHSTATVSLPGLFCATASFFVFSLPPVTPTLPAFTSRGEKHCVGATPQAVCLPGHLLFFCCCCCCCCCFLFSSMELSARAPLNFFFFLFLLGARGVTMCGSEGLVSVMGKSPLCVVCAAQQLGVS